MSSGQHQRRLKKTRRKLRFRGLFKKIKKNRFHLLAILSLLLITSLISFLNYQPGTWLTGWDNLHPEFNFSLNLKRSFFSVWQEYQSLGLLGGMAHAADLPRQLFLLLSSLIIPTHFLRYFWTFLTLFFGPLGVYFFIKKHFLSTPKKLPAFFKKIPFLKNSSHISFDSSTKVFAAFLGALFYLLNLSTVQTYYIPFSTFTSFYAFFPWLLHFLVSYLHHPSTKKLITFSLIALFSTPSFYVETLFVVLILSLLPFFLYFIKSKRQPTLTSFFSLLITQSYWLLPVIFFVITNGSVGQQAKNNLVSSPETYARNLQFANLADIGLLKGYLFNFLDLSQNSQYDHLLSTWRQHLNNPLISIIGLLNLSLILTGIYYSLKKNLRFALPLLSITFISIFFLLGGNLLLEFIPLLSELFRSPFTKFSLPLSFSFSIFFSIGAIFVFDLFSFLNNRLTYLLATFTISLFLLIYSSPVFSGHLISPSLRQSIPQEYFDLFDFFDQQDPHTRIANFPQHTFWGWNYYDWGYRGSGFLWYGLPQPILDRAFDVWEKSSQDYYEDMSTALYSNDPDKLQHTIDHYAIDWIIIDHHVIASSDSLDLYTDQLTRFLNSSDSIHLQKNFNDEILVYRVENEKSRQNFLSLTTPQETPTQPFNQLSLRPNTDWQVKNSSVSISQPLSLSPSKDITLNLSSYTDQENLLPVYISYRKTSTQLILQLQPLLPQIKLDQQTIDYSVDPYSLFFSISPLNTDLILHINDQFYELHLPGELDYQTTFYPLINTYLPTQENLSFHLYSATPDQQYQLTQTFQQAHPYQCYTDKPNRTIEKITTNNSVSLLGTDVVGCLSAPLPSLLPGLISTTYTYSSPTNTPANSSITDTNLSTTITTPPQPQKTQSSPTNTRQFALSSGQNQQLNLILEANQTTSIAEINYQNISVHHHPLIDSVSLSLPSIPDQQISLSSTPDSITISLPTPQTYLSLDPLSQLSLTPQARNCDNFNSGPVSKQITTQGLLYSSQNSISCDSFNLRHLTHQTPYLFTIDLQHQQGLLPTICLENHSTHHCDIFERLLDTTTTQSIIQPITNSQQYPGYTLHLYNQSFHQSTTTNLLQSLHTTPLPLDFISNISLSSGSPSTTNTIDFDSSHPAEFLYLFSSSNSDESQLHLYQTNSHHWLALPVPQSLLHQPTWQIILTLPFYLFHHQPLNHIDTSWYSTWPISPDTPHLVIFYWPQYLQFTGFILLFSLPLIIFFIKKSRHNS